jgi:hypothetical protein
MPEISQARYDEARRLKDSIGWSWLEFQNRVGWGPRNLMQFKALKLGIDDRWIEYLSDVAAAIESVPVPGGSTDDVTYSVERQPLEEEVAEKMRAAGLRPADEASTVHHMGQEVRVMLLSDIAVKLAAQYREVSIEVEMSQDERSGALWAIGRMAQTLGVADEVKALVKPASRHGNVLPPVFERPSNAAAQALRTTPNPVPWTPPQPSRPSIADAAERLPFINEF